MPRLVLPASKHVLYPMGERAILLTEEGSVEVADATKLLRFFGVDSDTMSLDKFLSCLSGFSGGYDGTVRLWEVSTGTCLRTLQPERRYERLDITRLTGVTEAQREALLTLGAVDHDHPLTA